MTGKLYALVVLPSMSQHFYYHCRYEWLCDTGETPHEGTRWLRLVSLGSSETILRFRSAATVIGCLMSNKGTGWTQFPFSLMTCTQFWCPWIRHARKTHSRNSMPLSSGLAHGFRVWTRSGGVGDDVMGAVRVFRSEDEHRKKQKEMGTVIVVWFPSIFQPAGTLSSGLPSSRATSQRPCSWASSSPWHTCRAVPWSSHHTPWCG